MNVAPARLRFNIECAKLIGGQSILIFDGVKPNKVMMEGLACLLERIIGGGISEIESFGFKNSVFCITSIGRILNVLQMSKQLSVFSLQGCKIGDDGLAEINNLITQTPTIEELDLSENNATFHKPDFWEAICYSNITHLNISENPSGTRAIECLSQFLPRSKSLRWLNISNTNIDSSGGGALRAVVEKGKQLETLLASGNSLGGGLGNSKLGAAIACSDSLRTIDLEDNNLTVVDICNIAEGIEQSETLTVARLCGGTNYRIPAAWDVIRKSCHRNSQHRERKSSSLQNGRSSQTRSSSTSVQSETETMNLIKELGDQIFTNNGSLNLKKGSHALCLLKKQYPFLSYLERKESSPKTKIAPEKEGREEAERNTTGGNAGRSPPLRYQNPTGCVTSVGVGGVGIPPTPPSGDKKTYSYRLPVPIKTGTVVVAHLLSTPPWSMLNGLQGVTRGPQIGKSAKVLVSFSPPINDIMLPSSNLKVVAPPDSHVPVLRRYRRDDDSSTRLVVRPCW